MAIANAVLADSLLNLDQELGSIVMESIEKPERGKIVKKPSSKVAFTDNPKTLVNVQKNTLVVTTPNASIQQVQLMRGKQQLTLDPKDVEISSGKATFNIAYLLPGEYYVKVKTNQFEENVAFSK